MALAFAQAGASEQGAKVDSVELSLASAGDRAVTVAIRMKARKGFIPAVVNVSGCATWMKSSAPPSPACPAPAKE